MSVSQSNWDRTHGLRLLNKESVVDSVHGGEIVHCSEIHVDFDDWSRRYVDSVSNGCL